MITKESIEEKYKKDCGIRPSWELDSDESYLINEILKASTPKEDTINPKMKLSKEEIFTEYVKALVNERELEEDRVKGDTLIVNTHRIEREGFELKEDVVEDRKAIPVFSGVLAYFPDALKEVAKCSLEGNNQHHADKPLHWDKDKSKDNEDALVRHLIDHTKNPVDTDGVLHLAKVTWRALAALQIYLESK